MNYDDYIKRIKRNIEQMKKKFNEKSNQNFTEIVMQDVFQDAFPVSDTPNKKTNEVLYSLFESDKELGYRDLKW